MSCAWSPAIVLSLFLSGWVVPAMAEGTDSRVLPEEPEITAGHSDPHVLPEEPEITADSSEELRNLGSGLDSRVLSEEPEITAGDLDPQVLPEEPEVTADSSEKLRNLGSGLDPQVLSEEAEITAGDSDPQVLPEEPEITADSKGNLGDLVQILSPTLGTVLEQNSATVVLEVPIGSSVELWVNDYQVNDDQIGQLETNSTTGTVRQIWYGVIFGEGDNILRAKATLNGESFSTETQVQAPGAVAAIQLTTVEKRVPADGRSIVNIEGQLLDENGNRSNRGGRVTLIAEAGEFVGTDISPDAPGFQVDARDGRFTAQLRTSIDSGLVQIRADMFEMEAFTQVQFETALRPSLVTGVVDVRIGAENTDYFGSFRDFLKPDAEPGTVVDLDGAAFAMGSVGNWLLTAAMNYDRSLNAACETCTDRLYRGDQTSEEPYPLYGDDSSVTNVTPSQDQFYFRLERSSPILGADPDYLMWGDYGTGREFATSAQEFSALSRQLHGAKVNYNFGNLQVSALYSQGGEAFQRDTIMPDGTTGFYFLTQRLVVPGSEEVYFELEELERPGTVVQRDQMRRGTDYEIDYDRGSLTFFDPVLRTEIDDEGRVLVRRMVITYQYDNNSDTRLYAGRLRYHFNREPNQQTALGTTYFYEDKGDRRLEVYGVDAIVSLGENYQLLAEYAHSNNDSTVLGSVGGDAYRFEFEGQFTQQISGRAYYRHADTEFSNQSTVSFIPGQTRYGATVDAQLTDTTQLRFRYDHEDNKGVSMRPIVSLGDLLAAGEEGIPDSMVDNSLTTVSAGVNQRLGRTILTLDWIYRDRDDRMNPDNSSSSSQLRSRLTTPLRSNLHLSLTNETTLTNTDAVYTDRTQASLDWSILPGVSLALNQNWYTRGTLAGQSTTSVNLGGEYRLRQNTVFTGRYSIENFTSGLQDTAAVGMKQRWTVFPGLHVDAAYERIFGSLFTGGDVAVGQGASRSTRVLGGDSLSLRVGYTDNPNFQAQVQYEYRSSGGNQTSNISASLMGDLSPSLTALFDADRRFAAGTVSRGLPASTTVRLGLAYRNPYSDRFNALLRYEYRQNPSTTPESLLDGVGIGTTEHLLAAEAIYSPNWQWEFYTKLGYRFSAIEMAETFSARSTLTLAQIRARYQVNRRLDLTGEARWIGQPSAGYSEMGWVGEVGFHATPNLRLALGYSSGSINNDRDFSGTRSAGGFYGGVTLKLDRLFQGFGLQKPVPQAQVRRQLTAEVPEAVPQLQAAATEPLRLNVSQAIDFTPESDLLSPEGRIVLESLATVMGQYGDLKLDIQGSLPALADLTPDHLGARRLQAARQHLLSRGIGSDRILIRSTGPAAPDTPPRPVTFALNGPAATFQLLSAQLGETLVGRLLGQELPQLANLPVPAAAAPSAVDAVAETLALAPAQPRPRTLVLWGDRALPMDQVPLDQAELTQVTLPLLPDRSVSSGRLEANLQGNTLIQASISAIEEDRGLKPVILATDATADLLLLALTAGQPDLLAQAPEPALADQPRALVPPAPVPEVVSLEAVPQQDAGSAEPETETEDASPLAVLPQSPGLSPGEATAEALGWEMGLELGLKIGLEIGANIGQWLSLAPDRALDLTLPQAVRTGLGPAFQADLPEDSGFRLLTDASVANDSGEYLAENLTGTAIDRSFTALLLDLAPNPEDSGLALAQRPVLETRFWQALAPNLPSTVPSLSPTSAPGTTAQRPTEAPFTLSQANTRRLEAALTFLLSRDLNALDALLQATGSTTPEVRGEVIDLDLLLLPQSQSGEGAL